MWIHLRSSDLQLRLKTVQPSFLGWNPKDDESEALYGAALVQKMELDRGIVSSTLSMSDLQKHVRDSAISVPHSLKNSEGPVRLESDIQETPRSHFC